MYYLSKIYTKNVLGYFINKYLLDSYSTDSLCIIITTSNTRHTLKCN